MPRRRPIPHARSVSGEDGPDSAAHTAAWSVVLVAEYAAGWTRASPRRARFSRSRNPTPHGVRTELPKPGGASFPPLTPTSDGLPERCAVGPTSKRRQAMATGLVITLLGVAGVQRCAYWRIIDHPSAP